MQSFNFRCLLLCWISTVIGQEFVFDLPTVVHHSTNHSMIVTMLKNTQSSDRLEYISLTASAVNGAEFFNLQKEYLWDATDQNTNAITFSLDPSHHQCPTDADHRDVFCRCLIRATARSESGLEQVEEKEMMLMKKRGHIFIQTDRPIYRPNDKVYVRFIPVDSQLRSLQNAKMLLEITPSLETKHAHQVKAWRKEKSAKSPSFVKEFHIPDTPLYGKWTISASFLRDYMEEQVFQSSFFVERYDLPAFEVKVLPSSQGFIVNDDESFQFMVVATYPYGKPVSGSVHVRIGLEHHLYDSSTPHYVTNVLLENGKASLNVDLANFHVDELNDEKFQIEASVVDEGGNTRTVIDDSFICTSHPIILQFTEVPLFYKPGLTYQFRIRASFVNGTTAHNVNLHVTRGDDAEPLAIVTNSEGLALGRVRMPLSSTNVDLTVTAKFRSLHGKTFTTSITTNIQPEISSQGAYLKLLTPLQEFVVGEDSCIDIEVSPTEHDLTVNYFVMSGDEQLLYQGSKLVTSTSQTFLIPILADMSPRSHLTAYYQIPHSTGDERVVMDSVQLFVQRTCHGTEPTISLHAGLETSNDLPKPGENVDLYLGLGEATSFVGISGVDSSSLLLRTASHDQFDQGLPAVGSRENFFEVMQSMDVSNRSEDVTSQLGRSNLGDVIRRREGRSLPRFGSEILNINRRPAADNQQNQTLGVCCEVGKSDLSMMYLKPSSIPTCDERSKTVDDDLTVDGCQKEFFRCCCQLSPNDEICQISSRSAPPPAARTFLLTTKEYARPPPSSRWTRKSSVRRIDSPRKVRQNFAHTWFNLDFENRNLSPYTMLSTSSKPSIPKLPDSITSWSLNMFTISQDNTLCIGKPFQFAVEHSLYMKVIVPVDGVSIGKNFFIDVLIFNHGHPEIDVGVTMLYTEGICSEANVNRERSEEKSATLESSDNGVASVGSVRFKLFPYQSGTFNITVILNAASLGWTERVSKTVRAINKNQIKEIHWIQVQNAAKSRTSRQLSKEKIINFTVPQWIVPGSYQVSMVYHSISSASLHEVTISEADKSGIDQYLYRLRNTVSRYIYLKNKALITEESLKELKDNAELSWNGVLTYIKSYNKHKNPKQNTTEEVDSWEYLGFSYSPSETAQPDLWLTCSTLRLLVEARDLVPLDQEILTKVLHWILLHYNSENGIFCKCSNDDQSGNLTTKSERKELHRQVYETSLVLSELNRIYEVYQGFGNEGTLSFITSSYATLQSALRHSTQFVRETARSRSFSKSASPLQRVAAAHAIYVYWKLTVRRLNQYIISTRGYIKNKNNGNLMWIETDREFKKRLLTTAKEEFEHNSDNVITTAKWLHLQIMSSKGRKIKYNPYAHWLISNKNTKEEKWFSLQDNLMAMEALGVYADTNKNIVPQLDIQYSNGNWTNLIAIHYGQALPTNSNLESEFKVDFQGRLSGTGAGWLQVTTTYEVDKGSVEWFSPRNSRSVESQPHPACPYQLEVVTGRARNPTRIASEVGTNTYTFKVEVTPTALNTNSDEATDDNIYVIDFGLKPTHRVIEEDLEAMSNEVEHLIEYYRITSRNLLIYVRGLKTVGFRININLLPQVDLEVPVQFYSVKSPGMRCSTANEPDGSFHNDILSECDSDDQVCLCGAHNSCPRLISSSTTRKTKSSMRYKQHCDDNTNFAYVISPKKHKGRRVSQKWHVIEAEIISTFKQKENHPTENVNLSETHQFWYRRDCAELKLDSDKHYLIFGSSAIQEIDGEQQMVKHLMDSATWLEWWPSKHGDSCKLYKKDKATKRLYKNCKLMYSYQNDVRRRKPCA